MDLIASFIEQYRREFDFFDAAARLVHLQLDSALASSGIRAIVTYRAKRPERLEQKLRQRNVRHPYQTSRDIYADIADFAGVRVALYFPGSSDEVDQAICSKFDLVSVPKSFPTPGTPASAKRSSAYLATHYRLKLRELSLQEGQKHYAEARVEVQVASVLMHAWAEVEHDLVYKPLRGVLSEEEHAILYKLNRLVLAGEVALERLQRAGEARVAREDAPFASHFELAAYLLKAAAPSLKRGAHVSALGKVDALFELLRRLQLNTRDLVRPFLEALNAHPERRAIADQLVDQVLVSDESRYQLYAEIRRRFDAKADDHPHPTTGTRDNELATFLPLWIGLEQRMREASTAQGLEGPELPFGRRLIERYTLLHRETRRELDLVRMMRNRVVHSDLDVDRTELAEAAKTLRRILKYRDENRTQPTA